MAMVEFIPCKYTSNFRIRAKKVGELPHYLQQFSNPTNKSSY